MTATQFEIKSYPDMWESLGMDAARFQKMFWKKKSLFKNMNRLYPNVAYFFLSFRPVRPQAH